MSFWVLLLSVISMTSLQAYAPDVHDNVCLPWTRKEKYEISLEFPFQLIQWHQVDEIPLLLDRPIIISLSRRIDRFNVTERLMELAGFTHIERFEGFDGHRLKDTAVFEELGVYTGGPGQKGCAASHLWIWQDFLENDEREFLFIGEDDLLPHTDFRELFPLYWTQTPRGFDIVLVGNQMDADIDDPLVVSHDAFCLHAYIISKAGARRLLDLYHALPKDAENMHVIDIFLIQMMAQKKVNFYCYNGAHFPDIENRANGSIRESRDNGICFQNANVEVSIHGK